MLDILITAEITKNLTRKWSINELARTIDKHYRPTYAAVQRLKHHGIMEIDQNGLFAPTLKDTVLLELAEKNRLNDHNKTIKIIKNKLADLDDSYFSVILFGSSVYKMGKDIDLLVIIPNSADPDSFRNSIRNGLGSFYSKVDLNIVNERSCYEMLNHPNQTNVMNEIMKNHLVLTGIENFYRILRRWKNAA